MVTNYSNVEEANPSFVLRNVGEFGFETREIPEIINPTDVLIRIQVTGICGSDVHYWQKGAIGPYKVTGPLVLGHESSGTVEQVGKAVTTLVPGDRVALEPGISCRFCAHCKSGNYNLCADMKFAATPPYDGTLSKYYVLPEDMCVLLPSHVSLEEGALVEPLAVAVHACRHVHFGNAVVVFGAGPVGLLVAAVSAAAAGARQVVIIDYDARRVDFAVSFVKGARGLATKGLTVDDVVEGILTLLGGMPADIVIEATGAEPCIYAGVEVVRCGGTMVQVGMGRPEVNFPISEMAVKEVNLRGSFRYAAGDYAIAVQLIANGKIDVKRLITSRYKFEEAELAFMETRKGAGMKILISGPE